MKFTTALEYVEARLALVHQWQRFSDGTTLKNDVPVAIAELICELIKDAQRAAFERGAREAQTTRTCGSISSYYDEGWDEGCDECARRIRNLQPE